MTVKKFYQLLYNSGKSLFYFPAFEMAALLKIMRFKTRNALFKFITGSEDFTLYQIVDLQRSKYDKRKKKFVDKLPTNLKPKSLFRIPLKRK